MIFLDIETVPLSNKLFKINKDLQKAWVKKIEKSDDPDQDPNDHYLSNAGLHPEFAKICCISIGTFYLVKEGADAGMMKFRVRSFYGEDEVKILMAIKEIIEATPKYDLVAHNGKGFDFPFITKRMVINQIQLPGKLMTWGKKPWDLAHFIDTMELWKFGSFKGAVSLEALCGALNVPSPKGDMDGSKVREKYAINAWKDISRYCEDDVIAMARCLQKMMYGTPIQDDRIERTTK